MSKIPAVTLLPDETQGFVHLTDTMLYFIPLEAVPKDQVRMFSLFLFAHRLPTPLFASVQVDTMMKIQLGGDTIMDVSTDNFSLRFSYHGDETSKGLRFESSFYLTTFLNALSFSFSMVPNQNDSFELCPISDQVLQKGKRPLRKTLSGCVHDLYAHQSLLEYLGFPLDFGAPVEISDLDESILVTLMETPDDEESLSKLMKSRISPVFAPLLISLLLLDREAGNTMSASSLLPRAPNSLYVIDNLRINGSTAIARDYESLKLQWETITLAQFSHMQDLQIALKLLENATVATFPTSHPLNKIVFNSMASLFMMHDELQKYSAEIFSILSSLAELFHPLDNVIEGGKCETEHFVFWLFTAMIAKTGATDFLEQKNPEQVLDKCVKTVMMFHPLLYDLLNKAGIQNLVFCTQCVFSLFSKVISGPKLWNIWIAALASGDPMDYFQLMMATVLIMIYPEIVDRGNVVDCIEREVKKLMRSSKSADLLIYNTWKLKVASTRN